MHPNTPDTSDAAQGIMAALDHWEAHMRRIAVIWGVDMTTPSEEDETDDLGDEWPDS